MTKHVIFGLNNISQTKPPVAEFRDGVWRLWTAYNASLTVGTYFILQKTGAIIRADELEGQGVKETVLRF